MSSPLDTIESEASPTVAHAEVCVDGRLLADYLDIRNRMETHAADRPKMLADDTLDQLTSRFEQLHRQVIERTHRYTFRCIERDERERLKDAHPPNDKQKHLGWDTDPHGFEPALAARAVVEIDGEPVNEPVERLEAHFEQLERDLPEGRNGWGVIAQALNDANYEGTQVPKSVRAIGDRFVSGLNSISADATESR